MSTTRIDLQNNSFAFVHLANGNEGAIGMRQGEDVIQAEAWIRWSWDSEFTFVGLRMLCSSSANAGIQMLRSGGVNNYPSPVAGYTWEELYAADFQQFNTAFNGWLSTHTVRDDLLALQDKWQNGTVGPFMTQFAKDVNLSAIPTPPAPVPPTLQTAFPLASFAITNELGAILAERMLGYATLDPVTGDITYLFRAVPAS